MVAIRTGVATHRKPPQRSVAEWFYSLPLGWIIIITGTAAWVIVGIIALAVLWIAGLF